MIELTPREKVLLLGKDLPIGTTDNNTLCYWCEGGESKDRSFSVTRQSKLTVAYICHRAKCGKKGYVYLDGKGEETSKVQSFTPNPFRGTLHSFEAEDLEYLDDKYNNIDFSYVFKAGWTRTDGPGFALVMPVFSPNGELRGHVIKRMFDDGREKSVTSYKILEGPWLCWYRTSFADVVVVEDQASALKAASFATAVSLLGAALTQEKMEEIKRFAKGNIWLALDKDASKRALEYLRRYRTLCDDRLNCLLIQKDLKDMSYKEIKALGEPFNHELLGVK